MVINNFHRFVISFKILSDVSYWLSFSKKVWERKISILLNIFIIINNSPIWFPLLKVYKNKYIHDWKNRIDKNNDSNKKNTLDNIFYWCYKKKSLKLSINVKGMLKIFDLFFDKSLLVYWLLTFKRVLFKST